ncbi:hypothetical protein NMY22_g6738 [Coprinellus aureogranulatus]|nr:hypothetical protein NMY22_g6738 [Coprinellus aureogranulatus]
MPDQPQSSGEKSRSSDFYHENVVFEIDSTLYRVGFQRYSRSFFQDLFSLPKVAGQNQEGESDENPIKPPQVTKNEFESLLKVIYPLQLTGPPELSKEQWIGVSRLSRQWDMPEVASLAIEKLSAMEMTPIEKVRLGKAHGVPEWLRDGYASLVAAIKFNSLEELEPLGLQTACRLLWARDQINAKSKTRGLYCGFCARDEGEWNTLQCREDGGFPQGYACTYCGYSPVSCGHGLGGVQGRYRRGREKECNALVSYKITVEEIKLFIQDEWVEVLQEVASLCTTSASIVGSPLDRRCGEARFASNLLQLKLTPHHVHPTSNTLLLSSRHAPLVKRPSDSQSQSPRDDGSQGRGPGSQPPLSEGGITTRPLCSRCALFPNDWSGIPDIVVRGPKVEGVVYRVPKHGLEECSSVFRDMFSLPQAKWSSADGADEKASKEGEADDNPIKLSGCTSDEFESLIDVMYPLLRRTPELSKEGWISVLKLSRLWEMPEVAGIAIEKIGVFDLKPVEKVKLGKEHGVPTWLKEGYTALIDDLSKASLSEMTGLGWETSFRILWARDEIARSQASTTPNSGGFWISSQDILCGYCLRGSGYNRRTVISSEGQHCGSCGQYSTSTYGIQIPAFSSLKSTTPQTTADDKSKVVADKVAEVFEEELKDAERRNAPPTPKPKPALSPNSTWGAVSKAMENASAQTEAAAVRCARFFFENVVFQIGGSLYRVPKHGLEKYSRSFFPGLFSLPQRENDSTEGVSEENPIRPPQATEEEFENLLEIIYPLQFTGPPALSKEQWAGVLRLARQWDMPEVAALAITKLNELSLSPIEKVKLGKAHGVPQWLNEGYASLVGDVSTTSLEALHSLGLETANRVLWAQIQTHLLLGKDTLYCVLICVKCLPAASKLSISPDICNLPSPTGGGGWGLIVAKSELPLAVASMEEDDWRYATGDAIASRCTTTVTADSHGRTLGRQPHTQWHKANSRPMEGVGVYTVLPWMSTESESAQP